MSLTTSPTSEYGAGVSVRVDDKGLKEVSLITSPTSEYGADVTVRVDDKGLKEMSLITPAYVSYI